MKPVAVSIEVPSDRREVYEYLDVLANHERFTDHLLVEWQFSGPRAGVGARARAHLSSPGRREEIEFEVVEAEPARRIVEEAVSAEGRRRTRGTYVLEELPGGGTRIEFEFAWLAAPRVDRLTAPLTRATLRRGNATAMRRLAEQLGR